MFHSDPDFLSSNPGENSACNPDSQTSRSGFIAVSQSLRNRLSIFPDLSGDVALARATYNTLSDEFSFVYPVLKASCLKRIHQAEQNEQPGGAPQPIVANDPIVAVAQMPAYLLAVGQDPEVANGDNGNLDGNPNNENGDMQIVELPLE